MAKRINWNELSKKVNTIDKAVSTGIKIGGIFAGAAAAGVGINKWSKNKAKMKHLSNEQLEIKKRELELQNKNNDIYSKGAIVNAPIPKPNIVENNSINSQEQLIKAYELFKSGVINESDYDAIKKKVLGI